MQTHILNMQSTDQTFRVALTNATLEIMFVQKWLR